MRYIAVTSPDINNGTGCRVTVWVAGCSHCCKGCHNPDTWNYDQGESDIWEDLSKKLSKPYIKGVTFSGGDPLSQNDKSLKELSSLITKVRKEFPEKDVWLFTGDVYEEAVKNPLKREIIDKCDVLVDGPYMFYLKDLSLPFRGSSNQRIILINEDYPYHLKDAIKKSDI